MADQQGRRGFGGRSGDGNVFGLLVLCARSATTPHTEAAPQIPNATTKALVKRELRIAQRCGSPANSECKSLAVVPLSGQQSGGTALVCIQDLGLVM